MKCSRAYGLTLIEALITMTICSIVLSFSYAFIATTNPKFEADNTAKQLAQSLDYARSRAFFSGETISICALGANRQCGSNWAAGWMLFANPRAVVQPNKAQLIQVHVGKPKHYHLKLQAFANQSIIHFFPSGIRAYQNGSFYFQSKLANINWRLIINRAGRTRITSLANN